MKNFFLVGLAALSGAAASGQNKATITQEGNAHEVSVVQQGSGNTSVINQSTTEIGNRATVNQSGNGNVVTINQGGNDDYSAAGSKNSVNANQSGQGETIITQTNGGNTISVYQGPASPDKKKSQKGKQK
ncbi:hypothetical protein [Spirosoma sp.]|uniref:hypothetical protein n=1 Tax=Spirosoma sp. TaxID=1899569 RepID=UPI002618EE07|nr:hypothetical protein [Spirosoma sp.]MCX6214727.1 hypothetical protein [Spirosoma sp.]